MATLEVNTQKIDFHSQDYLNIKSLLPKIQKRFPLDSFNLKEFTVNGSDININSDHHVLMRPIEMADHIKVTFSPNDKFTVSLINDLPTIIDRIVKKILICANQYDENTMPEAESSLSKVIEYIDTFIQIMNTIHQKLDISSEVRTELPIKELQIHLLSVMKGINMSHQNKDYIMLTDLLEYELKDNLTQWKILIVPTLKREAQSF